MKKIVFLLCIMVFSSGCGELIKDFLKVEREELETIADDPAVISKANIERQVSSGSVIGASASMGIKATTQYSGYKAVSSGLSMTMSISSQSVGNSNP